MERKTQKRGRQNTVAEIFSIENLVFSFQFSDRRPLSRLIKDQKSWQNYFN